MTGVRRRPKSRRLRRNLLIGTIAVLTVGAIAGSAPVLASPRFSSFWAGKTTSATRDVDMTVPINVGTRFKTNATGRIAGLNVYLKAAPRTSSTARLYDARGRVLASVRFTGSSRTGWRQIKFSRPVTLRAGSTVTAAVRLPNGHWVYSPRGLPRAARHGDLTALGSFYAFSSRDTFPRRVSRDALFVDVMFTRTGAALPTQPAPRTTTTTAAPTPTTSSTPSPTAKTATSTTTTSAPSASSTTTASSGGAIAACAMKPSASNTGASGSLPASGTTSISTNGTTLQGKTVQDLMIYGDNVTVKNVKVLGGVVIRGDNVTVDHVTAQGIAISGATNAVVQYANISGGNDATHITSDTGSVRNATLRYNYIHDPNPSPNAHYDGTQIRGADGVKILCSTYKLGAWESTYNAAVYMENANGGTRNVTVANNWIDGGGFSVYVTATNLTVSGNRFGRDAHWGICRNLGSSFAASGNVWDDTGASVPVCN